MATLILEDVAKVFGAGAAAVRAVDGVTMAVDPGEVVLVMGPSGSGKTTLLAIAGCLMRPDRGRVWLAGADVTALGERELPAIRRRHIGFIFQAFNLMSALTARENVDLVLSLAGNGARSGRASELLAELGLGQRGGHLPAQLSGGEKQRVAIARALATDPGLILADEPTANLDSRSGQQVMSLLAHAARERGKAVIIVSHDARLREIADRVLWMEDGRLTVAARGGRDGGSGVDPGDRSGFPSAGRGEAAPALAQMARDPVCGLDVRPDMAPAKVDYGGVTYHFCCPHCARAFSLDPARYAVREVAHAADSV